MVESKEIGRVVYELEQEHLRGTTECILLLQLPAKRPDSSCIYSYPIYEQNDIILFITLLRILTRFIPQRGYVNQVTFQRLLGHKVYIKWRFDVNFRMQNRVYSHIQQNGYL